MATYFEEKMRGYFFQIVNINGFSPFYGLFHRTNVTRKGRQVQKFDWDIKFEMTIRKLSVVSIEFEQVNSNCSIK